MDRSLLDTYESSISKLALDRDISNHLSSSTSESVRRVAFKIARCTDDHNLWFIHSNGIGWLHGRYWKCNQKLCSFCLSAESRKRRRNLLLAITRLPPAKRTWQFVTFTIENPHTSIASTRQIVNRAWTKFRKRVCFADVRACAKSEEFTLTRNGYHYHLHCLADVKRIEYQQWRFNWTECVESSGGASQNLFGYQTADGFLLVNVKPVRNPLHVVNELAKYITKSTSFKSLSRDALAEMADIKRWHRMFELLGELREQTVPMRPKRHREHIVHTKGLSDGWSWDVDEWDIKTERTIDFVERSLLLRFGELPISLAQAREILEAQWHNSESHHAAEST